MGRELKENFDFVNAREKVCIRGAAVLTGRVQGFLSGRSNTTPPHPQSKFKKQRFCRHNDIKRFTRINVQPKSTTQNRLTTSPGVLISP